MTDNKSFSIMAACFRKALDGAEVTEGHYPHESPIANEEGAPDFEGLLADTAALAEFVLKVREHVGDDRGHLATAHANLIDAWADIYKHKAGLP